MADYDVEEYIEEFACGDYWYDFYGTHKQKIHNGKSKYFYMNDG